MGVEEKASEEPRVTIENAFLIGNSNRSEDAMLSGGLIFAKIKIMDGACINCISNGWYISYFPETMTITKFTIEDCKAYDSFNCILYSWGARVSIKNSELIGAGGPVIIADHHDEDSATGAGGYISGIDVDGNSVLESYVAGSEGWFQQFNATSAATAIKQLSSQVFAQYGYTFTKVENTIEKFNLIAIYKSGSANGVTATPIRGYFNREASTDHVAHFMNFEDPTTAVILNNLKGTGAPLFQSNGAYCFFNGSALINPLDMQPVTPAFPLFRGDYINLFYASAGSSGYMGLVFGGLQAVAA